MAFFDDFGVLTGRYHSTPLTLADGQPSELLTDINARQIISGRWLEDEQHVSGHAGLFTLAVRDDGVAASVVFDTVTFTAVTPGAAGNSIALVFDGIDDLDTVVNAWNLANPNNQVSFTGQAGTFVPTAGTATLVGGADNTTWTNANYDYTPFAVDKFGRLKVLADLDVDFDYVYAEDAAHTDGALGAYVLAVRQDTLASSTSADGDYASFKVNSLGELYVHDTDANATLSTISTNVADIETELLDQGTTLDSIDTSLNNIETDVAAIETELLDQGTTLDTISSELQSLTHSEDDAHVSGHSGIMALAVRNDANATLTSADGDYSPIAVDEAGRVKITGAVDIDAIGAEAYGVSDALTANEDGLIEVTASFTDVAVVSVGAGQTAYVYGWQFDCDKNASGRLVFVDGANTFVYKTRLNTSAMPGIAEHWAEGGRIEIPGAAGATLKVQVRRRDAGAGTGQASGSVHVRIV